MPPKDGVPQWLQMTATLVILGGAILTSFSISDVRLDHVQSVMYKHEQLTGHAHSVQMLERLQTQVDIQLKQLENDIREIKEMLKNR